MIAAKDFLGNTLNIGDIIAYPGRLGGSMWMNVGEIVDIQEYAGEYKSIVGLMVKRLKGGKVVNVFSLARVVLVKDCSNSEIQTGD